MMLLREDYVCTSISSKFGNALPVSAPARAAYIDSKLKTLFYASLP